MDTDPMNIKLEPVDTNIEQARIQVELNKSMSFLQQLYLKSNDEPVMQPFSVQAKEQELNTDDKSTLQLSAYQCLKMSQEGNNGGDNTNCSNPLLVELDRINKMDVSELRAYASAAAAQLMLYQQQLLQQKAIFEQIIVQNQAQQLQQKTIFEQIIVQNQAQQQSFVQSLQSQDKTIQHEQQVIVNLLQQQQQQIIILNQQTTIQDQALTIQQQLQPPVNLSDLSNILHEGNDQVKE